MFSNLTIGFLFGAGIGAWIYSKMLRSSGGNIKSALIVAVAAGLLIMVLAATIIGAVTPT
jgi:hypothetical protein